MERAFDTVILDNSEESVKRAAELLKRGEVVGMPTETVYGLAANALDPAAVEKIFIAKGRPQDNPLIVHVAGFDMIAPLVTEIPALARRCAEVFWPGPLTMIMPKSELIPKTTSGGLDTVGIRMPSNKTARRLIRECGFPIAAPSANLSGSPSPTKASHVFNDMDGRIPCIIDDGSCAVGVESTVIAFEGDKIRLLRPGFISREEMSEIAEVIVDKGVTEAVASDAAVASPGMKYKHYSPKADVTIVRGDDESFEVFAMEMAGQGVWFMTFGKEDTEAKGANVIPYGETDEEQAARLFDVLRELDEVGAERVYARCPRETGVGLAVYNRLLRAAGFKVIEL